MSDRLAEIMKGLRKEERKEEGKEEEGEEKAPYYEIVFDLKGNFLSASPDAIRLSEYPEESLDSMSVWDVVSEEDHELMLENFEARWEGIPIKSYVVTLVTMSGKRIRIEVTTSVIVEDGVVQSIKGIFEPLDAHDDE